MEGIIIALFVMLVAAIAILQNRRHRHAIDEKIREIGGEVISTERKAFSTGPFVFVGRGRTVYRIEYISEGEVREGWVKFGDLSGPDWRL